LAQPDRFVLSAGHLQCFCIRCCIDRRESRQQGLRSVGRAFVPLEAIKKFRHWTAAALATRSIGGRAASKRPLARFGQGLANSVGMPLPDAGKLPHFNRPGFENLIDFNVYAVCGDGCMMEGISAEAASIAGHLKLSNLCWIYDNTISRLRKYGTHFQRRCGTALHRPRLERHSRRDAND